MPVSYLTERQASPAAFNWSSITPSCRLQYHDCFNGFRCARLKVPLDWSVANSSDCEGALRSAAIGIVTLPATVPETDPSFGGTVLINPGGPGGSGTGMVRSLGPYFQNILKGERNYEILGFDPRGVAISTPRADCYNSPADRAADGNARYGMASLDNEVGRRYYYQDRLALSELCGRQGPGSILNHMSTASVARDMLEIIDRVDELRHGNLTSSGKKPGLQYLGFSYGTHIGNTFASMFPGRVERMVLDGVTNSKDYVNGDERETLRDVEAVIDFFYDTCFEAGVNCPLWQSSDAGGSDIKGRVNAFIDGLVEAPIPIASRMYEAMTAQSRTVSEPWVRYVTSCAQWKYNPPYAFRGPFGHKHLDTSQSGNMPAAPPLILSARYDVSTPLANAYALEKLYPGSAVVIQESYGHLALGSSPSNCTNNYVRTYFETGKLPPTGSTCSDDCPAEIPARPCPGYI
ncbi:Alpha/Beta hydrolase protein [Plectosphaerella plurivora]|uniref:Alpha/Beta hydrolase protein n=1 Tax=Plectosphaerella plurivora TaxID=936078 RepID=A0A9P8VFY8_9PEZI|nr:Alpha/Beta hydrolase protein [Plectosphaerella plurivora]